MDLPPLLFEDFNFLWHQFQIKENTILRRMLSIDFCNQNTSCDSSINIEYYASKWLISFCSINSIKLMFFIRKTQRFVNVFCISKLHKNNNYWVLREMFSKNLFPWHRTILITIGTLCVVSNVKLILRREL